MNPSPHTVPSSSQESADETLRLIASLPAPDGLSDRVQAALRTTAPHSATVLHWPVALSSHSSFLRGAAAAAIVCVVAGGGWRIYSHVPAQTSPQVIQMPQGTGLSSGFGAAGARHVPDTLNGPVLTRRAPVPPLSGVSDGAQAQRVKAIVAPANPGAKTRKHPKHSVVAAPVH